MIKLHLHPCPPFPVKPIIRLSGSIFAGIACTRIVLIGLSYSAKPDDMTLLETIEMAEPVVHGSAYTIAIAYLGFRGVFCSTGTLREALVAVGSWLSICLTGNPLSHHAEKAEARATKLIGKHPNIAMWVLVAFVAAIVAMSFFIPEIPPSRYEVPMLPQVEPIEY